MPSVQKQNTRRDHFIDRQVRAVVAFRVDHVRNQVILRVLAALFDEVLQIRDKLTSCVNGFILIVFRAAHLIHAHHRMGPVEQVVAHV